MHALDWVGWGVVSLHMNVYSFTQLPKLGSSQDVLQKVNR